MASCLALGPCPAPAQVADLRTAVQAFVLPEVQTPAPPPKPQHPLITNTFAETDLRQALSDVAAAAGVTIVADATVQGTVSAELKDQPLEKVLDILVSSGGFTWIKDGDMYLVGLADPTNPNFSRLAVTLVYKPDFVAPTRLTELLSANFAPFVKSAKDSDVVTITAAKRMADRILADFKTLDQAPQRIELEALVTEVSVDTLNQFQFSWLWKNFGITASDDGFEGKYSKVSAQDVATMKSLIGDGRAEVRASPRIMTVEGKEASIEVAQESYFQVVSGPVNFPYTTLQLIKTGISLKMTPRLLSDGRISVELNPEVSDATGSGAGGLPINTARRASTTVRVNNGETIIIGGMSYESKRRRDFKIPFLGDLPLIGNLFKSHKTETKKTEVVIMITPRVVPESGGH